MYTASGVSQSRQLRTAVTGRGRDSVRPGKRDYRGKVARLRPRFAAAGRARLRPKFAASGMARPLGERAPQTQTSGNNFCTQFCKTILQNFANFWRARSRLHHNEILQENMRSTAFVKLYKICILLHRCNLKILAKNPESV